MTRFSAADSAHALPELTARIREFATEREWHRFHDPKNLVMLLASEVGELVAIYRWVSTDEAESYSQSEAVREKVSLEIGDVGIALLELCDRVQVDLLGAIARKIDINAANYPQETSRGRTERP